MIALSIALALGMVALGWVGFILYARGQKNLGNAFNVLATSVDAVQKQLILQSEAQERSQDAKSESLRRELREALHLSRTEVLTSLHQSSESVDAKVAALDNKLDTRLKAVSEGVQSKLETNIKEGFRHFEKVQEHLKNTGEQLLHLNQVGGAIHELNALLKLPHLRGNFGEAMLEKLLSDLLPADAFQLQYQIVPGSSERVDAVIKYPDAVLPVDSKFPREQVAALFEASDEKERDAARKVLYDVIRSQAKSIREKYVRPENGTTEMALLFVPSESLYFEIVRHPKLTDELSRQKVFAVSPNTFSVALHAISVSRKYYEMAKGLEQTMDEVRKAEQHFTRFEARLEEVGHALNKAQESFQTSKTHLSRYSGSVTRFLSSNSLPKASRPEKTPNPPPELPV